MKRIIRADPVWRGRVFLDTVSGLWNVKSAWDLKIDNSSQLFLIITIIKDDAQISVGIKSNKHNETESIFCEEIPGGKLPKYFSNALDIAWIERRVCEQVRDALFRYISEISRTPEVELVFIFAGEEISNVI